jgi:hypothetical protein
MGAALSAALPDVMTALTRILLAGAADFVAAALPPRLLVSAGTAGASVGAATDGGGTGIWVVGRVSAALGADTAAASVLVYKGEENWGTAPD